MVVNTMYEIGEEVFFECWCGKTPSYIKGEIVRLSVYKNKSIRYHIIYSFSGETLETDRWENDLVREDLTGSAMPRVFQVRNPQKTKEKQT